MAGNSNNIETEIYSDWYIVKQNIWLNWFRLVNLSKVLVEYKIKGIPPQSSRSYTSTLGALYSVGRSIGISKYKKFLTTEQLKKIEIIINKVKSGKKANFKEIQEFMDLTDFWFETSGMSQIDKDVEDQSQAIKENR